MEQIPVAAIVSERSVTAGLGAMERIHGRHLPGMSEAEAGQARAHWRHQVEEILFAVHAANAAPAPEGSGRATIVFTDDADETVQVSVDFQPELRDLGGGEVEGTPAQVLAIAALEALESEGNGPS
jgi:hypothetical protein